jgi:DNA ligase (NAD+)
MKKIERIKELVKLCNSYRNAYYNHQPLVSDDIYDRYFDELTQLESETNCYLANSPTQSVGYEVVDVLPKVQHEIPLLSLAKTKSVEDVVSFAGNKDVLFMIKGDGLTTKLSYKSYDGITSELVEASTRGNGVEGSLITHNAKTFNIPLRVNYGKDFTVVGESVILKDELDRINALLPEDNKYSNCRNLASGSLSLLDSKECAKRHIHFMAFDVIEGMDEINSLYDRFDILKDMGFEVIYHMKTGNMGVEETADIIQDIHEYANDHQIPCDGVVIRYDDYAYGMSLGRTSHHYNYGLAKKEEDDFVESIFRGIEWNTSRNGVVTPTGLFDEITILDSQVSRATLHNLDYIDNLKLRVGDRICCSKRNMVIPAIEVNLDYNSNNYQLPIIDKCPSCGKPLIIKNTGTANVLYCPNENCPSRKLAQFVHFVSKGAMDIKNLSEATLEKFISLGYINDFKDIFHLSDHYDKLVQLDGFGTKSVQKLLLAIEKSRDVRLESFIAALGIPNIGLSAAKTIAKFCNGDIHGWFNAFFNNFDWTKLDDFGKIMAKSIDEYLYWHIADVEALADEMNFIVEKKTEIVNNPFSGKTLCVTGKLNHFNRDSINEKIALLGAKAASSVSKKTDYLITNEQSGSSKYKKAVELNISIITEKEFLEMCGE